MQRRRMEKGDQPKPHIGIQWTNYGNTPAYDATTTFCDPVIRTEQAEPNFTCVVSEKETVSTVIGPKQTINLVGKPIEEADLLATRDGGKHIYLLGKIEYRDEVTLDDNDLPTGRLTWFCTSVTSANITQISIPNTQPGVPPTQPPVQTPMPNIPLAGTPLMSAPCVAINCSDQSCSKTRVPVMIP